VVISKVRQASDFSLKGSCLRERERGERGRRRRDGAGLEKRASVHEISSGLGRSLTISLSTGEVSQPTSPTARNGPLWSGSITSVVGSTFTFHALAA